MQRNESLVNGSCALYVSVALGLILALAVASPAQVPKTDPFPINQPPPAGAILDLSGTPIPGGGNGTYQQYTVNFHATLASTAITFAFREDPARIILANVSVTDLTHPSGNLLVNGDFSGALITSNGNNRTPNGWTYANQFGAFAGGGVFSGGAPGFGPCYGQAFCWNDGAVQAFDAISQTIATTVGDTYEISFSVADNSMCETVPGNPATQFTPCNFSRVSTNGDTTDQFGNGIDITVYAQGGLPSELDQCAAPTVGVGTGAVGTATGPNTCGAVFTVTQVDGSGNALAYTVAPANPPGNNGNPYDSGDDTLVGIQNNSGGTLNSMVIASSDTSNGGIFGFDHDGPCNALFHTPAYAWCSNTGFTGYEGPDNTFSNIMTTSCPIFNTCATSGTVNFTSGIPNGGSTWFALEASSAQNLTPPTLQVETSNAVDFTTTTNSIVSVVFNGAHGQLVQGDADFPLNNVSFPANINPATVKFMETNRFVSDCQSYTRVTPFSTCLVFDHAGNDAMAGTTGHGAKYEIICTDANPSNSFSEANCPTPLNGKHIRFKDIFDLPTNGAGFIQPAIAPGTTVSFLHWFPNTIPGVTSWSPSANNTAQPACTNVFTPAFACDIEDALQNKYGPSNGFGSDNRKGDYLLVYNIPMLCSQVTVKGKNNAVPVPVNTPCVQGNSTFFFSSPLTFDFLVSPAKCNLALPVACGNGWLAAPPDAIFHTFDLVPGPDLPGATDFEDFITCGPGVNCTDVITGTPGAGPPAGNLEFKTTAMNPADGQYLLQWSARDTVKIRERNIQLLNAGPCPNPFPNDPNIIPAGGPPAPPCYSTKLFNVPIDVDNTPPTITGPTLSTPNPATPTTVTATYSCADPVVNGVASGIATCGAHAGLGGVNPTPQFMDTLPNTVGPHSFGVTATDVAGNSTTSPTVNYTVYNICALYDQTKAVHSGATVPVKLFLCDSTSTIDMSSSSIVVHATNLVQTSTSTSDPVVDAGNANPDNDFRFDPTLGPSGGYIFNLKTTGLGTGNYVIQFTVSGSPILYSLGFGVK